MSPKQKQRFALLSLLIVGLATGVGLVLLALNENINLFFSPSQVVAGEVTEGEYFRIGGMVSVGSVEQLAGGLTVRFALHDQAQEVLVEYTGILPDLFREGQGIVAEGKLDQSGKFIAQRVLAKHDENYMPPEVNQALMESAKNYRKQEQPQ